MRNRILLWGGAVVGIGLMVWGLANLAASPTPGTSDINLSEPVTAADQTKGNSMAKVVLVEYSDFECPACAGFYEALKPLYAKYDKQVLFVFRHFPLAQHENATLASKAAEAAGRQGKFWEMHDLLFETQRTWTGRDNAEQLFTGYATQLGLDINKFTSDLKSKSIADRVERDFKSGISSRVDATPTFFLNGKKVNNLQSYGDLDVLIGNAVSQK